MGLISAAGLTLWHGGELPTSYPSTTRDCTPALCVGGRKDIGAGPRAPMGVNGSRFAFTNTGAREGEETVMSGTRDGGASASALMCALADVRSASGDEESS